MPFGVGVASDEAGRRGPVNEPDHAVVAQDEVISELADRRSADIGMASYGEQELMLGRREAGGVGLLLAPVQKPPQARPKLEQMLVVAVGGHHLGHLLPDTISYNDVAFRHGFLRSHRSTPLVAADLTPRLPRVASALTRSGPPTHGSLRPEDLGDFSVNARMLKITAWAVPIGLLSAGLAFVLLRLIGLITNLVFYQRLNTHLVAPGAGPDHPWWLVLLAPVAGGLLVGLMARFGSEKIRGHGMPEAIEAILVGGSRIQRRVALLKPISAAISIGTGGPFGAEGPIIMTGGAAGSILAQYLHLSADERKTLLVAGAAGGMAATFNAPLASVLLAVELLLFEWRPRSFVPVVAAVATSTVARGALLGTGAIFALPDVHVHLHATVELLCVVAGLTGGVLAIVATSLVYASEDAFRRLPIHWMWWPALGGLIIGAGGLIEPRALGVGYDVIDTLLTGHAGLSLIIGILIVKTAIWSLSLGSGTSGGVLAPVFMIGAALGALEGHVLPAVVPGFWALVGLAAVLGGVMRSPLTGVVFPLELTHAWP